jgi:hypothetical protein
MSTGNLPGNKGRPERGADNLTTICEPIVYKMWEPERLTTLWAFTACYRDSFPLITDKLLNSTVFWVLTPCSSERTRYFGEGNLSLAQAYSLILLVSCFVYSSTLKMEAVCSSEMLCSLRTTRRYNRETVLFIVTAVSTSNPL